MKRIQGLFEDCDDDDGGEEKSTTEIITGITRDGTQMIDESGKPQPPAPKTVSLEDQSAVPVHPTKRAKDEEEKEAKGNERKGDDYTAPEGVAEVTRGGSIIHEMLTHVPEGLRDQRDDTRRFRYDVESRPDEATALGYESLPVEEYGEAMLRGLGWEPGKPIGLHATEAVEPIVAKKRPGFHLGLGATEKDVEVRDKLKELQRKGIDIDKAADEYINKNKTSATQDKSKEDDKRSKHRDRSRSRSRSRSKSRDRSKHRDRKRSRSRSRSPRRDKSRSKHRDRRKSKSRSRSRSRSRSKSKSHRDRRH